MDAMKKLGVFVGACGLVMTLGAARAAAVGSEASNSLSSLAADPSKAPAVFHGASLKGAGDESAVYAGLSSVKGNLALNTSSLKVTGDKGGVPSVKDVKKSANGVEKAAFDARGRNNTLILLAVLLGGIAIFAGIGAAVLGGPGGAVAGGVIGLVVVGILDKVLD